MYTSQIDPYDESSLAWWEMECVKYGCIKDPLINFRIIAKLNKTNDLSLQYQLRTCAIAINGSNGESYSTINGS